MNPVPRMMDPETFRHTMDTIIEELAQPFDASSIPEDDALPCEHDSREHCGSQCPRWLRTSEEDAQ